MAALLPFHSVGRAFEFEVRCKDSDRDHPFAIPPQDGNRHLRADQVKVGMSPVQVLELLGSPDDCSSGWEYDMDSKPSFTLVLRWKDLQVSEVERVSPARWKRGLERDESIAR